MDEQNRTPKQTDPNGQPQAGAYRPLTHTMKAGKAQPRLKKATAKPARTAQPEKATKPQAGKKKQTKKRFALPGFGKGSGSNKPRKPSWLTRQVVAWWDRLFGAFVSKDSFGDQQEEYEAHRTSRDYMWNTIGFAVWGMVFPILTIVVTQLVGVDLAGQFSLAFVAANLLMIVANYGVRTFQVSDVEEKNSFADYQVNRWITCLLMLVVGYIYCTVRGYADEMFTMCMALFVYKAVDGLADVYEGRLQQRDKLYLAGVSITLRSAAAFIIFALFLLITRSLPVASIAMAVVSVISFVFVTFPLTLLETPKSPRCTFAGVVNLFKKCFPLFIALFLYAFIDNLPKFLMEGVLTYDNQLYFNALYFPAQAILLTIGFIYKPLLVRMSNLWNSVNHRKKFDLFILAMVGIIVLVTLAGVFIMSTIGIPVMSFMYGVDFSQFATLSYVMLAAGGVTAGIDFLYQVITILRRQKVVTELYLITFVLAIIILMLMIDLTGLEGAVVGYLVVMVVLFFLLVREYVKVRIDYQRHPDADPARSIALSATPKGPQATAGARKVPAKATAVRKAPANAAVARKAQPNAAAVRKAPAGAVPAKKASANTAQAPTGAAPARKAPANTAQAPTGAAPARKAPANTAQAPTGATPVRKAPAQAPANAASVRKAPSAATVNRKKPLSATPADDKVEKEADGDNPDHRQV